MPPIVKTGYLLRRKSCARFVIDFSRNQKEGIYKVLQSLMNLQVVVDQIFAHPPPPSPFLLIVIYCDPMVIYIAYKKNSMCSYSIYQTDPGNKIFLKEVSSLHVY